MGVKIVIWDELVYRSNGECFLYGVWGRVD